ncbi:hypothetical protein NEOKW01_1121 [Nematocida sp. AWRm80]|nr:hypothetical protein NEOKW01_1121 [Nematocida sp. AWRm80]
MILESNLELQANLIRKYSKLTQNLKYINIIKNKLSKGKNKNRIIISKSPDINKVIKGYLIKEVPDRTIKEKIKSLFKVNLKDIELDLIKIEMNNTQYNNNSVKLTKYSNLFELSIKNSISIINLFKESRNLNYNSNNKVKIQSEWTEKEIELLKNLKNKTNDWIKVSSKIQSKNNRQCKYKYNRLNAKKGKWTEEEDALLTEAVHQYKYGNWSKIKELVPGRTAYQCRERYVYVLDPRIDRSSWTEKETEILLAAVERIGTKHWAKVSKEVQTRNLRQCRERYLALFPSKPPQTRTKNKNTPQNKNSKQS